MLLPTAGVTADQRELLSIYKRLEPEDRTALRRFAEFLLYREQGDEERGVEAPKDYSPPLSIPRPEQETVIGAIKRLRQAYPMLAAEDMLDQTSALVTANLVHGRPIDQVIDELEALFASSWQEKFDDSP
jgi:hypothetical protein